MVSCSVSNCDVTKRNNPGKYTFFRFPSDLILRIKWLKMINRIEWTPKINSTICSKHFEDKFIIKRQYRQILMKESIPTLFVPVPIKPTRRLLPDVYRDIVPPSSPEPASCSSSEVLTLKTRNNKLVTKCTRLKKIIDLKDRMLKNLKAKNKRMFQKIATLEVVVKSLRNSNLNNVILFREE